jgi:hypothetical protein
VESTAGVGAEPSSYGGAVEAIAQTVVASAVNRAAFDICYASCLDGTACDRATGVCVPLPCRGRCPGGSRCKAVEGRETCVFGEAPDSAPQRSTGALEPFAGRPRTQTEP